MQRYPVDENFINTREINEEGVRNELFAVFLSANPVERIEFAKKLLPGHKGLLYEDITKDNPYIITAFQSYCYEGNIYKILAFLREYLKLPKSSALTDGNPKTARETMEIRIQNIKNPKGGRRRKTKKSKRRQRKTRRRHK